LEATVDLSAVPRRSLRVVSRVVAGEHILVPLASRGAQIDSVFNLNDTGTFIWDRIDGRKTGAEIAAMVAADFQVSADRAGADCGEFLSQLLEARAIDLVEPSEAVKR
jgi:hypothetical protein